MRGVYDLDQEQWFPDEEEEQQEIEYIVYVTEKQIRVTAINEEEDIERVLFNLNDEYSFKDLEAESYE
ncbi:hypothetical protein EF384_01235 [Aerococcus agrisoli]|uniref:DUF1292 domain-containing protein n=1 Tax=Aerococcus agrisoli TaxID=2487350 RepID=A0A3N4H140_9LACT|nr:hypothetical protein [Aerococcus agrisoli]RPA65061.1 hypothetical protein EF384_01235 [Aerococcus agrisoli]